MKVDLHQIKARWLLALLLVIVLLGSTYRLEHSAHTLPKATAGDLSVILANQTLTPEDYAYILAQTGLAPEAIDELLTRTDGAQQIQTIQRGYFTPVKYTCIPNGPVSREEWVVNAEGQFQAATLLAPLHNGDILVTFGTHTLGWRHGHAALVVDASQKIALEALVLGQPACLQSADKWAAYPNFILLRPKHLTPAQCNEVAQWALTHLQDIPYNPLVGLLSPKAPTDHALPQATQCAHLVWSAYHHFGWDIDGNGGLVVTPRDLTRSDQLEIIQLYGL